MTTTNPRPPATIITSAIEWAAADSAKATKQSDD
jgi:hypothetical protein